MLKTDKDYWHRYVPEYERVIFSEYVEVFPENIMEFGVHHGHSIQWLADKYPNTNIHGVDITPRWDSWPTSDHIFYHQLDQGNPVAMWNMFQNIGAKFDIIIDDGSHESNHQLNCLFTSLPWIKSGGFYVIEDIHSSFVRGTTTILNVLLALKRYRELDIEDFTPEFFKSLGGSPCSFQRISELNNCISYIHTFRRSSLPLQCWNCRQSDSFDYKEMKCMCGQDLLGSYDSMAFILRIT